MRFLVVHLGGGLRRRASSVYIIVDRVLDLSRALRVQQFLSPFWQLLETQLPFRFRAGGEDKTDGLT